MVLYCSKTRFSYRIMRDGVPSHHYWWKLIELHHLSRCSLSPQHPQSNSPNNKKSPYNKREVSEGKKRITFRGRRHGGGLLDILHWSNQRGYCLDGRRRAALLAIRLRRPFASDGTGDGSSFGADDMRLVSVAARRRFFLSCGHCSGLASAPNPP